MDRFRYNLHGGGLRKHPEGNFILLVDHKNEIKKYEEPGQECNRGHKNSLPVKLWDCPMCTELLRKEIERLKKEKDWQLNQIIRYKVELYFDSYGPGNEGRKIALEETEEEMQQALKE